MLVYKCVCLLYWWVTSMARSCAAWDDNNKDNVCKLNIPAGIKCPPPSKTIAHITRFGTNSTHHTPYVYSCTLNTRSICSSILTRRYQTHCTTRTTEKQPASSDSNNILPGCPSYQHTSSIYIIPTISFPGAPATSTPVAYI